MNDVVAKEDQCRECQDCKPNDAEAGDVLMLRQTSLNTRHLSQLFVHFTVVDAHFPSVIVCRHIVFAVWQALLSQKPRSDLLPACSCIIPAVGCARSYEFFNLGRCRLRDRACSVSARSISMAPTMEDALAECPEPSSAGALLFLIYPRTQSAIL